MKNEIKTYFRKFRTSLAVAALASAIGGGIIWENTGTINPVVSAQTDSFLSQRISQIEQRFNQIESRLNRLEIESRLPNMTVPRSSENNETEVRLLRSQIETLQFQIAELECGVIKLDERTLSNAARQTRRQSEPGKENEPCRLNPSEPIRSITRP
jgi:hypothetical protein